MIKLSLSMLALSALCLAQIASAATLKNLDPSAYKIVIVEGDARTEHTIESQQEISDLCEISCSLYIGSDPEPYDVAARNKMEIDRGEVYLRAEPESGQQGQ